MKYFALIFGLSAISVTAQVNTEAMRGIEYSQGFQSSLAGQFTWVSGNSEFVKTNGLARIDYVQGRYQGFLVGNYELGKKDGDNFIHNGFMHFRNVIQLIPHADLELFSQLEFNEFLQLERRQLLGGDIRLGMATASVDSVVAGRAYLGLGLMHEIESIDGDFPDHQSVVRATSYLNVKWNIGDRLLLQAVAYYQPRIKDAEDYRILAQSSLTIKLYKNLAFETAFKLRFDSQPPRGVKTIDMESVNGLRINF
jgi:putative salt-induced outer membrane protein YdiY